MDEKTARKYRDAEQLPSQMKTEHTWRTRPDSFEEVWPDVQRMLELNDGLEAKTLFEHLQREQPGRFADGQLRTLQRRVKVWRALEGPAKQTYFAQIHEPGQLCQSDFTHMSQLGITIQRQPFAHMVYHFVTDLLQLGDGQHLLFRELRGAECRATGGAVGVGWRAGGASDRLSHGRRAQTRPPRRLHPAL